MRVKLSVPSKTFLLGEYLALKGGPSLVVNTSPRFELTVETVGEGRCEGIPLKSPAARWVRQNSHVFRSVDIAFKDPHEGKGGMGASSAQFLSVYCWGALQEHDIAQLGTAIGLEEMWQQYREWAWTGEGVRPSGADILAQMTGKICLFEKQNFSLNQYDWNFDDLEFYLLRTGHKIPTHEHLSNLSDHDYSDLKAPVLTAVNAISQKNSDGFIESVNDYGNLLQQKNLVAETTLDLLEQLKDSGLVKAAKGCGALGVDFILAVTPKNVNSTELVNLFSNLSLQPVASSHHIDPGLQMLLEWQGKSQSTKVDISTSKIFSEPFQPEL